jgi:radical SAM protein with 4Fe4S-binding SPASM domain
MNEKIDRLTSWKNGKKIGPLSLEIWPTNRCNLNCIMCGTWASRRRLKKQGIQYSVQEEIATELSEQKLIEIIKEAKMLEMKEFLITGGGEPFMRKKTILKMMDEIKKQNSFGNINTNGTLLSEDNVLKIVEMNWDMMMFSLDSAIEKTHDFIRGSRGTFKKLMKTLNMIKKLKVDLKKDKPKVVFNTVITNMNYDKLKKIIKLAKKVQCEDITFIPLIKFEGLEVNLELNEDQISKFKEIIKETIDLSRELEINTNLENLEENFVNTADMDDTILSQIENSPKNFLHSPCFEPFLHLLIRPNGQATCCCMLEGSLENIKNKSLGEVWLEKYFTELRKQIVKRNLPKECKNCVFSQFIRNESIRESLSQLKC